MTARLADAQDPTAIALKWLSSTFRGVRLVESGIIVPRFGGIEVHVAVPGLNGLDTLELSAAVLVVDAEHPLFPAITTEGNRTFGSEFVVKLSGTEGTLILQRTLPNEVLTETFLTQNVAEIGVAAANLHNALTPIFSKESDV